MEEIAPQEPEYADLARSAQPLELRRLLRAGMGRAVLAVRSAYSPALRDVICAACINDLRYDCQVEEARSSYLFEILQETGEPDFYRRAILSALSETGGWDVPANNHAPGERSRKAACNEAQRLDLAVAFARQGDGESRRAIAETFYRNVAHGDDTGASQLVDLDGINGLLAAVDCLPGQSFDDDFFRFQFWVWTLEQRDGKAPAQDAMDRASTACPALRRLLDEKSREDAEWALRQKQTTDRSEREAWGLTTATVRERLRDRRIAQFTARRWSLIATDEEMATAARDLLDQDSESVFPYLVMFHKRPFPLHPAKLIQYARSPDEQVAWAAIRALCPLAHEDVRTLALDLLQDPSWCGEAARLLGKNYHPGDERLVEELFRRLSLDGYDIVLHDACWSLRDLVKALPTGDWAGSLLLMYEYGPCSNCRNTAVEHLAKRDAVPAWMITECLHDADESTREWAAGIAGEGVGGKPGI